MRKLKPVYADLLRQVAVDDLSGTFTGTFFEITIHGATDNRLKDLLPHKERVEDVISEVCREMNQQIEITLQQGLTETFSDKIIDAELKARYKFGADGTCYEKGDSGGTHTFKRLDDDAKNFAREQWLEYLADANWWSAYKTPWLVKLRRMGFIDPRIKFDGEGETIERAYFVADVFDFKTWFVVGCFERLRINKKDKQKWIDDSDEGDEEAAEGLDYHVPAAVAA